MAVIFQKTMAWMLALGLTFSSFSAFCVDVADLHLHIGTLSESHQQKHFAYADHDDDAQNSVKSDHICHTSERSGIPAFLTVSFFGHDSLKWNSVEIPQLAENSLIGIRSDVENIEIFIAPPENPPKTLL